MTDERRYSMRCSCLHMVSYRRNEAHKYEQTDRQTDERNSFSRYTTLRQGIGKTAT